MRRQIGLAQRRGEIGHSRGTVFAVECGNPVIEILLTRRGDPARGQKPKAQGKCKRPHFDVPRPNSSNIREDFVAPSVATRDAAYVDIADLYADSDRTIRRHT